MVQTRSPLSSVFMRNSPNSASFNSTVSSFSSEQFEEVKAEARKAQQEAREELYRVEASYSGVKRELEVLRVEHEKYVVANEQAAPQNK